MTYGEGGSFEGRVGGEWYVTGASTMYNYRMMAWMKAEGVRDFVSGGIEEKETIEGEETEIWEST